MKTALIILADGFEEIEALSVIDILRRGHIQVTIAGLDKIDITSTHNITIKCDVQLDQVKENLFDAIILPGGEPGTTNLENSELVTANLEKHVQNNKYVCAICAAPRILDGLGFLNNKKATSFPGTKAQMKNCTYIEEKVVIDGQFITSRAPGTAMAFAYTILEKIFGKKILADQLRQAMLFN